MTVAPHRRGWREPVSAHLALSDAVKALAVGSKPVRDRLDRATAMLTGLSPADYHFPEHLRHRAARILRARVSVREVHATGEYYHFGRLTTAQQRQIVDDIIALYEACLLDLGKMEADYFEIIYPKD